MKRIIVVALIFLLLIVVIPFVAFFSSCDNNSSNKIQSTNSSSSSEAKLNSQQPEKTISTYFTLFDQSDNTIKQIDDRTFLIGAIPSEMPLSYNIEALKAQLVAIYTVYDKKRTDRLNSANPSDYDFTINSATGNIFMSNELMKNRFGNKFDEYYSYLSNIVDEMNYKKLLYNNENALTTYYAISSGVTDSSEDIWNKKLEYLTCVDSECDKLSSDFENKKYIDYDSFKNNFLAVYPTTNFSDNKSKWIDNIKRTNSNTVLKVTVGDKTITGENFRQIYGLKSANFIVEPTKTNIIITTYGYGHNVGMSQYGANYLANNGYNYLQILQKYYPNTVIS